MTPEQNANDADQTRAAGELLELEIAGVNVNFRWAPAGKFLMGSPEDEKRNRNPLRSELEHNNIENQHEVTLTYGFWIAETPTTQELWQAVLGYCSGFPEGEQFPEINVDFDQCICLINCLNSCYCSNLPSGYKFAIPTEAQWEYACRAGTTTPFNFGSTLNGDMANCNGKFPYGTSVIGEHKDEMTQVRSYPPNPWGLYDMHGNVLEWTSDWYDVQYYTSAAANFDPKGPDSGKMRVLRGGSWNCIAEDCRSAMRFPGSPGNYSRSGFRLAIVPQNQQSDDIVLEFTYPLGEAPEVARMPGAIKTLTIAGVKVNFRWAPANDFTMRSLMGSLENEPERRKIESQRYVALTQGFWIAETPTTQEFWQAVMGNNPSYFKGDSQLPVDSVSWEDCYDFVIELIYNYSDALPNGYRYALPTEAQWEYACRAGTRTPFSFGSTLNGDKANCYGAVPYGTDEKGQCKEQTTPVKSYAPNPWGLYDMHGNVFEWCRDWYAQDYAYGGSYVTDPIGPRRGNYHVLRGGCWSRGAGSCRSAYRYSGEYLGNGHCLPNGGVGFRLILIQQPTQRVDVITQREYHDGDEPEATREAGAIKTIDFVGVKVNFHWAPAGRFLMGSPEDAEENRSRGETQHEVTLTQGFWIAETPTTRELWQTIMWNNPYPESRWGLNSSNTFWSRDESKQLPVGNVSWNDCQEFIEVLNRHYTRTLPEGYKYDLPTDAQWEYACRAGTTSPFNIPYGTIMKGKFIGRKTPVKSYPPNTWGLYYMHGNVWEWCADGYDDWYGWDYYTSSSAAEDPAGPESGSYRVLRSGSWSNGEFCQSACWSKRYVQYFRDYKFGFRLVLVRR